MTILVASLYLLVIAGLFGSAVYVLSLNPEAKLNQAYTLLCTAQLTWVISLFVFNGTEAGPQLLLLGRLNFAAAALVTPAVLYFVCAFLRRPVPYRWWLLAETIGMAALSLFTGIIDKNEIVQNSVHVTIYGVLFPLYIVHLIAYLIPAIRNLLVQDGRRRSVETRQSVLLGIGILVTAVIAIATNVAIPYAYGNFKLIDVGTLATIMALAAISYAAVVEHLFDIRVAIKRAVVIALTVAFFLELYQGGVEALAKLLPLGSETERHFAATAIALTVNAFTQQPLRWWLEKIVDNLFGTTAHSHQRTARHDHERQR